MAVGPVRALLAAHATAVRNRGLREVGRNGVILFGLLLGVVVLTSVGPGLVGLAVAGYALGRALPSDVAATILGALASALGTFGGIVSGTLGGTRQLTWESYRVYPLRPRALFVAEVIAGLGDLVPALLGAALLTLFGAVAVAQPRVAPIAVLAAAESVVALLLLQIAVGGLAAALVRRLRVAVVIVLALAWVGSSLPLLLSRADLAAVGHVARRVTVALPLTQGALGLADAAAGAWGAALARQLYPLAFLAVLAGVARALLERELEGDARSGAVASERPLRLASPAGAVAELHFRSLVGSPVGRFGLVLPLVTVFLVRGPLATLVGRASWVVPASFSYVALSSMHLQTSLFGLDGHGVKALLTLPISARDLLAGKARGLLLYQLVQTVLLVVLLALFQRPGIADLVAGCLLAAASFGVQVALGQFTSSWMPRPIARRASQKSGVPIPLLVVSTASWAAVSAALGGVFHASAARGSVVLVLAMAACAGLAVVGLYATRGAAARYLDASRERIAERIAG